MDQTNKHHPDLVTDNGDKTTFNQQPSSSKEEKTSTFISVPGYPQGKRSADTEGINCSEVTGNGKDYM